MGKRFYGSYCEGSEGLLVQDCLFRGLTERVYAAAKETKTDLLYSFSLGKSVQTGKGAMRLALCEAPTRETRPDHYTGNSMPYSLRQVRGFFNVPC